VTLPYGIVLDPESIVASLLAAAVAGLVLGALAVAITAVARK